jgi:predicted transcriptional regulator
MKNKYINKEKIFMNILGLIFGKSFESLGKALVPHQIQLMQKIFGFGVTQALYAVCKYKIPDMFKSGPKSAAEIAATANLKEGPLSRVLTALCSVNIFKELPGKTFMITKEGKLLYSDSKEGFYSMVMFFGKDPYRAWGELTYSLETGKPAMEKILGKNYYSYLDEDEESEQAFDQMKVLMDRDINALLLRYDFSGFKHIADVGGGTGFVLAAILKKYESMQGTLIELPYVIKKVESYPELESVKDRINFMQGDIFKSVDITADGYFMKNVLHNWNDDKALQILKNVRKVIPEDAKLLISESIQNDFIKKNWSGIFNDILMLLMHGGIERTEAEYRELLKEGGFKVTKILQIDFVTSIIEAEPV